MQTAATSISTDTDQQSARPRLGIGWRPQMARAIELRQDIDFIELMAEDFCDCEPVSPAVQDLIKRKTEVIVHSTSLSVGGAEIPSESVVRKLSALCRTTGASLLSDHIAFVRSTKFESGHLLPIRRSSEMLDIIIENIQAIAANIEVPFVVENIASLFEWPDPSMSEAQMLREILTRTSALMLLDVSNLYANCTNHGWSADEYLQELPLDKIAYVHIAGGHFADGIYHDTHAGGIPDGALQLLRTLCRATRVPRVMVEIDDNFPNAAQLDQVLERIKEAVNG